MVVFDICCRINGIESGRLDKQLQLLERQKLHTVRLVNNDIRLTRVTLDHIEACSGHSINQLGECRHRNLFLVSFKYITNTSGGE